MVFYNCVTHYSKIGGFVIQYSARRITLTDPYQHYDLNLGKTLIPLLKSQKLFMIMLSHEMNVCI